LIKSTSTIDRSDSSGSSGSSDTVGDEDYLLLLNNDLRIAFSRILLHLAGMTIEMMIMMMMMMIVIVLIFD